MSTITVYLEDDNNEEVDFNGETLTFPLQMIKIWTINWTFKILKVIHFALAAETDLQQKIFMKK